MKIIRKMRTVFLTMLAGFLMSSAALPIQAAGEHTVVSSPVPVGMAYYTPGSTMHFHGYCVENITVDGVLAYCIEITKEEITSGTQYSRGQLAAADIARIAYYGYGYGGHSGNLWQVATQIAIWEQLGQLTSWYMTPTEGSYDEDTGLTNTVRSYIAEIKNLIAQEAPLNRTDVHNDQMSFVYGAGDRDQKIINLGFWSARRAIEVDACKKAENEQITSDNAMYPLAGAQFSIYEDEQCTRLLYSMEQKHIATDASGHARFTIQVNRSINVLWAVETKAPEGYQKDPTPVSFTIAKSGSSYTASFTKVNHEIYGDAALVIRKQNARVSSHPSSLAGAEFTVRYYDSNEAAGDPERTWVLQTLPSGDEYTALFSDEKVDGKPYKTGGDDFYYAQAADGSRKVVLPLGTITIQETKAPEGYTRTGSYSVLDHDRVLRSGSTEEIVTLHIVRKGDTAQLQYENQSLSTINKEDEPQMGTLHVQKFDKNSGRDEPEGDAPNLQTSFHLINNSSSTKSVHGEEVAAGGFFAFTTDEKGRADISEIEYGRYTLEETEAPEGYTLMNGSTTAEVVIDHDGAEAELTNGEIADYPLTYRLVFSKQDLDSGTHANGDADLSGTYRIANASAAAIVISGRSYQPGEEVMQFTTDRDGNYTSAKIFPYGTYRIEEIKAPTGYSFHGKVLNGTEGDRLKADVPAHAEDQDVFKTVFANEVYKGDFAITKVTGTGRSEFSKTEEGVEFTAILSSRIGEGRAFADWPTAYAAIQKAGNGHDIKDADGRILLSRYEYAVVTTDEKGYARSHKLAYGRYSLRQTNHFEETKDITGSTEFTVSRENQPTVSYVATNQEQDYCLHLVKKDSATGKTVALHGAGFRIYRQDENGSTPVVQKVGLLSYSIFTTNSTGRAAALINTFRGNYTDIHDAAGTLTTPLKLKTGKYEIREVDTPYGYIKLDKPFVFEAVSSNIARMDEDGDSILEVTVYDDRILGRLEIEKKIKAKQADKSFINREDLSGFGFTLYAAEDIIDPADGSVIAARGEKAKVLENGMYQECGEVFADASGRLRIDHLPLGSYVLRETTQPDGTVTNTKTYPVEFKPDEKEPETRTIVHSLEIENDTTEVSISKKAAAGSDELPGASMRLTGPDGNVIQWTSGDKPYVIEGLKAGETYVLHEDLAPIGYVRASEISFTIADDGSVQKQTMIDKTYTVRKADVCGLPVSGAVLAVYQADQNGSAAGEPLDRWTTDGSEHRISNLEVGGTYVLVEEQVPDGFVRIAPKTFKVKDNHRNEKMNVLNTQVEISKEDIGGQELPGAVLTVIDKESGQIVDQWTSGTQPHYAEGLVENRTYTLREDTSPLGYVCTSSVDFTVGGKNRRVVLVDTIERVAKVDENGNYVSGAVLTASAADGTLIDRWTTGAHILDISEQQKEKLQKGEQVSFEIESGSAKIMPTQKAVSAETASAVSSGEQKVKKEEFCKVNQEEDSQIAEIKFDPDKEISYTAAVTDQSGVTSYYDIDLSGNETDHRLRGLQAGQTYIVREESPAAGYYMSDEAALQPDDSHDHRTEIVDNGIHYAIAKVDAETGEYVAGVTLTLTDITDAENPQPVALPDGGVTADQPMILDNVLTAGHIYELSESKWISGYHQAVSVQFQVSLSAAAEQKTVTMKDVPTSIAVLKCDETGKPVAGAHMEVAEEDGDVVYSFISDASSDGTDISAYVKGGETYILRETEAPFGFALMEEMHFTVDGTPARHQLIEACDERETYYAAAVKVDEKNPEEKLAGAEFTLYTQDGSTATDVHGQPCVGTSNENGEVIFEVAYNGDTSGYYFQETKAPDGYLISNEKYPVELQADYDFALKNPVKVTVADKAKPKLPNTGVDAHLFFWSAAVISAAAVFIMTILYKGRCL